jgi:hypothetical protein
MILFRDLQHSIPRPELLRRGKKFLGDRVLLVLPDVVQSRLSLDALTRFMEILDGAEPQISPEIVDGPMLLAREFGHNNLITSLAPQGCVLRRKKMHATYHRRFRGPRRHNN